MLGCANALPCLAVPCFAVLCCAVPCRAVPCCAVLCCAVLCCAVLCCALVNYAASEPQGLPGASRGLLGHAGAPRSLKLCKTSVSPETSSNILRGGCAIRERARKKSTCYRFSCPGRGSGPRDLSRILGYTRCGGCAVRERAREKLTFCNCCCVPVGAPDLVIDQG